MSNRHTIANAKFFFIVAVPLALLVGHGQSMLGEHSEIIEESNQQKSHTTEEELLIKKLELIKNNFEVQKKILVECEKGADRLVGIFSTIEKVEVEKVKESRSSPFCRIFQKYRGGMKKTHLEREDYRWNREQLLADVLSNLRSDVSSLPAELYSKLSALSEWMNLAKQNEQPFELLSSKHVERIPDELYEHILEPMTNSEHRIRWKRDIKELLDRNDISALKKLEKMKGGKRGGVDNENEFAVLKKLRELNAMRIYDESVNIRLHIIRAMFEAGMVAYENTIDAAALLAEQQEIARKLKDAVQHTGQFILDVENLLIAGVEKALKKEEELTKGQLLDLHVKSFCKWTLMGFSKGTAINNSKVAIALAEGSKDMFAQLMGKPEHFAQTAEDDDGLEMLMKYELMQDVGALELVVMATAETAFVRHATLVEEKGDLPVSIVKESRKRNGGQKEQTFAGMFKQMPSGMNTALGL